MDAEEEQAGAARRPGAGEPEAERWPPASLTLSARPLPDVVFGAPKPVPSAPGEPAGAPPGDVTGPGEVTGPQPVVDAAFAVPPAAPADERPAAPPAGAHRRRMALLVAVVLVGALVVVLAAVAVWPSGSDGKVRQTGTSPAAPGQAAPGNGTDGPGGPSQQAGPAETTGPGNSSAPGSPAVAGGPAGPGDPVEPGDPAVPGNPSDPGSTAGPGSPADPAAPGSPADPAGPEAAGGWPVLSGTTSQGIEVTYRTVETAEGYFEGEVRLVNATGAPLPAWTLSFGYPGASIRNVWGGDFRPREDGKVVVTGNEDSTPVAAGAWVNVRFGGAGTPSRPQGCTVNGAACGF
ncbi:cellulose binding domain-containing protein [Actinocorallia populi]|uniref:cellulose binding domain-containing protein n=1 Tax=Actinocorallia populi TaxID=2079200 RepID=UPI001E5047FB|nr:cellulose binding domain-containing protein [Actinocorallia populi]